MDIDQDLRGLQHSRWDPKNGDLDQKAPPTTQGAPANTIRAFTDKEEKNAYLKIASLVSDGELAAKVWTVVQTLVTAKEHQARGVGVADTLHPLITRTITKAIKTTVQEELKEVYGGSPTDLKRAPTWAQRTAAGLPHRQAGETASTST